MEQSSTTTVRVGPAEAHGHVGSPLFHAFLECEEFEGHKEVHFDLTWVVGHNGMAHGFPENGGCPDPFSIVSGHLQKTHARTFSGICESSRMLRSRVVSAQLQRTKALSTERQVPHCRITDDERCADLSEMLRTLVWVILECEWSNNSPWTARESRGTLVYPLVAPRGTAAHVHHGCGHPLGALASASRSWPQYFFVQPLCCPHHCHFVLCRWWYVVPLFLWARVGQILVDVFMCVARSVVRLCMIFFF